MILSFRSPWYSPSPLVLRKIFERKTLGPDLGENKVGLNVAVRLAPDWLVAGLIIEGVSMGSDSERGIYAEAFAEELEEGADFWG
jgi:hypothetical protein